MGWGRRKGEFWCGGMCVKNIPYQLVVCGSSDCVSNLSELHFIDR
jgi:hypothetical protein